VTGAKKGDGTRGAVALQIEAPSLVDDLHALGGRLSIVADDNLCKAEMWMKTSLPPSVGSMKP
jgi:hypothetical protein